MRDSSLAVSTDTQQLSAYNLEEMSAITGSASVYESDGEISSGEDALADGAKKRKRKRPSLSSCDLCKARKVKCDRVEPSCGGCARHNRICIYQERKKPGLRVGYGRELEDKINRLEAILQSLGRRVEDHILHDHGPSNGPSNGPDSLPPNYRRSPDLALYRTVSPSASVGAGSQSMMTPSSRWPHSNAADRMQYSGQPDAMSLASVVEAGIPESMGQASSRLDSELPPPDLLYTLVDLYFKHVNTWSPILDRKATFDTLFGSSTLSEPDRILLHAIVATTLRFSKDPRLTPKSKKMYHDISKQKVQLYGLEHPTVRALQALVILALDVFGTSNGPQGWNLLALIAKNIVQLGLTVEKSVFLESMTYPSIGTSQAFLLPQPKSWIEDEERRRLFWMVYVLDRYATVATALDFTLAEKEMDRPLPCRYDLFSKNRAVETKWFRWAARSETTINKPENLGSFSYHCEVLRILSRVHEFLKRPMDIGSLTEVQQWRENYRELDSELSTWLQNLPGEYGKISQLCHSDPASKISNWIMLHAAFVTSVIRLHSAAAYPTIRSHLFTPSHTAMQRCLAAVESLREIVQDVLNTAMLDLLGPPFAFSLWVSARLLLVHAATMECEVDPKIHFFIGTLEQMGQYWEVAKSYSETLSRVVEEHQQSERLAEGGDVVNMSSAKRFSTMRRSAYDLNLLMSQRLHTVLNPTSIRNPSMNELEYLDVFDFFNYPRLSTTAGHSANTSDFIGSTPNLSHIDDLRATSFVVPTPESDWLVFKPPYD